MTPRMTAMTGASRAWLTAGVAAALCSAALCSCSHSALIHSDDTAYRRSLERLQHTRQLVAASLAPDDEQAMFLQAEGLFRYRFASPGRAIGSYVAQTLAAAVDFPVLDSLAGDLDLYSLRLKSCDGAVQLWETLLVRSPSTPLRPLALYRLGWAHRNTMASGLPGGSDERFDELIAQHAGTPLAAFAADARRTTWRSQGRATAWSILPGMGQIYAGETTNGAIRVAIAVVASGMVLVPSYIAIQRRSDLSWGRDWPLLVTGLAGAIILTTDYSSSYQDAMRAVLDYNERSEAAFEAAHPDAP